MTLLAAVSTAVVAIYSVRSQQRQALKRAEQQHAWQGDDQSRQRIATINDRNVQRKWSRADHQLAQAKEFIVVHIEPIRAYISDTLGNASALKEIFDVAQSGAEERFASIKKADDAGRSGEIVLYHVAAIKDTSVMRRFQELIGEFNTLQKSIVGYLMDEDELTVPQVLTKLVFVMSSAASLSNRLDEFIIIGLGDESLPERDVLPS